MARRSRRRMSYTSKRRMPPRGRKGRFTKSGRRTSYVARGASQASGSRSGFVTPSLLVVGLLIGGGVVWMRKSQANAAMQAALAAQAQAAAAKGAPFPTQTSRVPAMLAPAATGFIQSAMNLFKPVP